MTESSFSCWLSSEIKEFRVSVKYEWTSLLTLGIPMTIDTVKEQNKADVKLSFYLATKHFLIISHHFQILSSVS